MASVRILSLEWRSKCNGFLFYVWRLGPMATAFQGLREDTMDAFFVVLIPDGWDVLLAALGVGYAFVIRKDCSWRKGPFLAGESGLGMA